MVALKRLFVGVDPGTEARHRLAALLSEHAQDLPGNVVPPENWHLTIRFLGSVSDSDRDRLRFALSEAVLGEPFRLGLAGLGAFPKPRRASVLWLGVADGGDRLASLAERVEGAVVSAGFPSEDRPFRAHLTLSRLRPTSDVQDLVDGFSNVSVRFDVIDVVLYASVLGRGGARYEVVDRFPLA